MTVQANALPIPGQWDRRGLPGWTYHSPALFELEKRQVFLTHWQIVGHVCDLPAPGDWLGHDMLGERALIMRGQDGVIRAFHNLCRHRGARVADGVQGHCKAALVCPFHGWVYNLDGSLCGASRPETFGGLDRQDFGLKPIDLSIWHGFLFIRFTPGGPDVAEQLAAYDPDIAAYRTMDLLPASLPSLGTSLAVNWKSVRDVDNEGYHVALTHPALQDLYGRTYRDMVLAGGLSASHATFGDVPGRQWSVRNYVQLSPPQDWLPAHLQRAWTYYGLFPNAVLAFTPESVQFYQEIPISPTQTRLTGRLYRRPEESRQQRLARYLTNRIDRETSAEDQQLSIWSNESMTSSGFDRFHLSDLEYGVRRHHDQLRALLPVMALDRPPKEYQIETYNEILRRQRTQPG